MTDIALTPAAPDEDFTPQVPPISIATGNEADESVAGTITALTRVHI